MARSIYGADGSAQVVSLSGTPTLAAATVKSARTGGVTVTDIQNMSGANLGGIVTPDSRGQIIFQGPDGSTATYWLDFGDGGPRWGVRPVDMNDMVNLAMAARELAQNVAPGSATPEAGLPYVNNHPTKNLALALEGLVIPRFASASARDTAFTAPSDGDRCYRTDLHAHQTYRALGTARWVTDPALINEFVLASDTASISFTNIPQEWRHLVIKFRARATGSNASYIYSQPVGIRFNNDTANNYSSMGYIRNMKAVTDGSNVLTKTFETTNAGSGGSATTTTAANYAGASGGLINQSNGNQSSAWVAICAGSSLSSLHGGGEIKIEDYVGTATRKSIQGDSGYNDNGGYPTSSTGYSAFSKLQGGWNSNVAITRIDLLPVSATAFAAGSRFSLYGWS
ncbi:hypothetical protein SEA_BOGOTA_30 [Streptomyces phage Bogota]|nr:hypothetical protein SEA_UNTPL_30 [Streptomyces phage UNTPL]WIC89180.1 hypothetical protein SEA_BOGOTA_30 [Streptomyces phage Bogota]